MSEGNFPFGILLKNGKKLGRHRNAAHIKTVEQFFYVTHSICHINPKVNIAVSALFPHIAETVMLTFHFAKHIMILQLWQ